MAAGSRPGYVVRSRRKGDFMIQIRNLRKEYPGATPLKDVNADIEVGEVISVIGHSGAGKSTFLRCLNRLETPTAGHILVDGIDVADPEAELPQIRRKIGMVFQPASLFGHKTVIGNIMMAPMDLLGIPKGEARQDALSLLRMVGLEEKADCYPDALSEGQKQRAAIARALAMEPEILLFDEPAKDLDPIMAMEVLDVIRTLAEQGNMTMVIVTREMDFAKDISNRIFYMDEGEIYEQGTPEQLFEKPKREKTRAFVYHIRSWHSEVRNRRFDFYRMSASLNAFCMRQFVPKKLTNAVNIVFEEILMNRLLPAITEGEDPKIGILLSGGEEGKDLRLLFSYPGLRTDPLLEDDVDDISGKLIARYSKKIKGTSTQTAEYEII